MISLKQLPDDDSASKNVNHVMASVKHGNLWWQIDDNIVTQYSAESVRKLWKGKLKKQISPIFYPKFLKKTIFNF